jgi:RNA polymerase sigma-70 factor (ECF subfamily)
MNVEAALRQDLLAAIPSLRAFAVSLVHDRNRADDLVQDTIMRAWAAMDRFERGTNLNAWLFTILRNHFYSQRRKLWREVEDPEGSNAAKLISAPDQQSRLDYDDMRTALAKLQLNQREALLLVGAEGLNYDEAAAIIGVPVGTVKSRVNRARVQLTKLLNAEPTDEIRPNRVTKAAVQVQG